MSPNTDSKIKSYKDLIIWQRAISLVIRIYKTSKKLPKEEIYGLQSQIKRSVVSIPSDIAEGFARFHNKEYRNFLYIALGSCAELTTQVIIASRLEYIEQKNADEITSEIDEISKMTIGLIKKLNTNN